MKIAIIGAGVAGPAFAYWMRRAGHDVTLVEAAPRFRTGGYVIDFWGLGYTIAEKMGVVEDIRKVGYSVQELRAVGANGATRASLGVGAIRRATKDRYTTVARGDLASTIYRTIENDVETMYSDTVTSIDSQPDRVSVTFEHAPARDFDMLIGADGLHSTVRKLTFGPESEYAHYLGCQVAACVIDGYRPRDELVYITQNLSGRQIGRFSLDGDRTLVLFIFRSSSPQIPDDLEEGKALVRDHFRRRMGSPANPRGPGRRGRPLPGCREPDPDGSLVCRAGGAHRRRRRVRLAARRRGTGLALVESYVLAGELARAEGDLPRAFAAYESRLRKFIDEKQNGATKFIAFFAARTDWGIWLRNAVMRAMKLPLVGDLVMNRSLRDDIDLPDYQL